MANNIVSAGCAPTVADNSSCSTLLTKYYNAYVNLVAGVGVQRIQSADFRIVDYTPANIDNLISAYNQMWDICGADSGYPRLVAAGSNATIRGRPAIFGGC